MVRLLKYNILLPDDLCVDIDSEMLKNPYPCNVLTYVTPLFSVWLRFDHGTSLIIMIGM